MMKIDRSIIVWWSKFLVLVPLGLFFLYKSIYFYRSPSMETTLLMGDYLFSDRIGILFFQPKYGDIIMFRDPNFIYSKGLLVRLFQKHVYGPPYSAKRVIGLPGDHVQGVIEDGKPVVYRNGKKLDEPYINHYPLIAVRNEGNVPPWSKRSYDPDQSYENQPFYLMNENQVIDGKRLATQYGDKAFCFAGTPVVHAGRNLDEYDVYLGPNQYWVMGDNRHGGGTDSRYWGPLDYRHVNGRVVFRIASVDKGPSWMILDILADPLFFWGRVRWSRFFQKV